jgi:hypothetical protein
MLDHSGALKHRLYTHSSRCTLPAHDWLQGLFVEVDGDGDGGAAGEPSVDHARVELFRALCESLRTASEVLDATGAGATKRSPVSPSARARSQLWPY